MLDCRWGAELVVRSVLCGAVRGTMRIGRFGVGSGSGLIDR